MGTVTARWWLFEALTAIVIGIKNSSEDYLLGLPGFSLFCALLIRRRHEGDVITVLLLSLRYPHAANNREVALDAHRRMRPF
jgi:hypothetical protein